MFFSAFCSILSTPKAQISGMNVECGRLGMGALDKSSLHIKRLMLTHPVNGLEVQGHVWHTRALTYRTINNLNLKLMKRVRNAWSVRTDSKLGSLEIFWLLIKFCCLLFSVFTYPSLINACVRACVLTFVCGVVCVCLCETVATFS